MNKKSTYENILGKTLQDLKVSKRELIWDIKDIAGHLEYRLEQARITDSNIASMFLQITAHCYLRGRGVKLGNHQSLADNKDTVEGLTYLILNYVFQLPETYFPKMHELIPHNDVLAQADRVLQNQHPG